MAGGVQFLFGRNVGLVVVCGVVGFVCPLVLGVDEAKAVEVNVVVSVFACSFSSVLRASFEHTAIME